jgi:hypothetical protein
MQLKRLERLSLSVAIDASASLVHIATLPSETQAFRNPNKMFLIFGSHTGLLQQAVRDMPGRKLSVINIFDFSENQPGTGLIPLSRYTSTVSYSVVPQSTVARLSCSSSSSSP